MIFLGAGASSKFRISTSKKLTSIMRDKVDYLRPDLMSAIDSFYTGVDGEEPDFEIILTQLSALTEPSTIEPFHRSLIFNKQHEDFHGNYSNLINEMYVEVCKACTAPFIQNSGNYLPQVRLDDVFLYTYDALFGLPISFQSTRKIMIFTTNYDPSIELWCQKRNIECIDGTRSMHNPELKKVLPIEQHIGQLTNFQGTPPQKQIGLVRLHGSVWSYTRDGGQEFYKLNRPNDRLAFPDLYERLKGNKPVLIFPGQEDNLRLGRWDQYYQYFKQNLKSVCLFIGYSFRHTVINEQIRSNLETGALDEIAVLNPDPDKVLSNLFQGREIPEDKIVRLKGHFGDIDGIWKLNELWFEKYFGHTFRNGDELIERTQHWKNEVNTIYS